MYDFFREVWLDFADIMLWRMFDEQTLLAAGDGPQFWFVEGILAHVLGARRRGGFVGLGQRSRNSLWQASLTCQRV